MIISLSDTSGRAAGFGDRCPIRVFRHTLYGRALADRQPLFLREPDRHVSGEFSRHIARCRICCVFLPGPTHACGLDQCVSGPAAGRCRPCLIPAAARALADWLISADGQAAIGAYAIKWRAAVPPLGRGAEITYSCSASASDQASALAPASARTRSSSCANSAAAPEKTTRPSSRT